MKSYNEIADIIFKRRDEYIAKQKKKKRVLIHLILSITCCVFVLSVGFGLWQKGIFNNNIPIAESSNGSTNNSHNTVIENEGSNDSSKDTHSGANHSSDNTFSSENPIESTNNSSDGSHGEDTSDYIPPNQTDDTPSDGFTSEPPSVETDYFIDSIDKINFYSAKKIINDYYSFFPLGMNYTHPKPVCLSNIYVEYPIDRNKIFTISMVTYFTIELHDEQGFLAQKLGGTGLVEVVVVQNDIEERGQMITFKRQDKYYTCLQNSASYDQDANTTTRRFSSHKYVDGFNMVKNLQQENYEFTVRYEGPKVISFECQPYNGTPSKYRADEVSLVDDYCVVIFMTQRFTIDQLEGYFKSKKMEDFL